MTCALRLGRFGSIFGNVSTDNVNEPAATLAVDPVAIARRAKPDVARMDLPIHQKIVMVVALGCVGGFGFGVYAQRYDGAFWHLVVALMLGFFVLCWLTGWWIVAPIGKLSDQAERLSRTGLTSALKALPVGRSDEIGRIAKALHDMGVATTKGYLETQTLRRNMDHQIAVATRRATNELSRLVMCDALTDLNNRRFLDIKKADLFDQVNQSGQDLACVMIDLDNFKLINDTLGHEAGDHLLVFLAGLINAICRSEDLAIRLGGDEFLLLMPDTDPGKAAAVADMIGKHFTRQAHALFPEVKEIGLSFGISTHKADRCPDIRAMMRIADQRLYTAKNADLR